MVLELLTNSDQPAGRDPARGKRTAVLEGRAATGYDHGYDAQVFYLGLALDPKYVEGFVEGCLEKIGEDDTEGEALMRDLWEDDAEKETVLDILIKAECDVLPGRPAGPPG